MIATTLLLQGEELVFQGKAVTSKGPVAHGEITITNQRFIWEKSKGGNSFLAAGLVGLTVHAFGAKSFSFFLRDFNAIQGVKANEIEFLTNDGTSFSFGLQYPGFSPKNIQEKRDYIVSYIQGVINQK